MERKINSTKKKIVLAFGFVIILLLLFFVFRSYLIGRKLEELSLLRFDDQLQEAIKDLDDDTILSIGTFVNENKAINFYTKNGEVQDCEQLAYEIGSITKTMTAGIIHDLCAKDKINLDARVNEYIDLRDGSYPRVIDLLTHTGGYKSNYSKNIFSLFHPLHNFGKEDALKVLSENSEFVDAGFEYSNFSYGTLGLIIEKATGEKYENVLQEYLMRTYGMENTTLWSENTKYKNNNLFDWGDKKFYQPAGAVISNIEDMMTYLEISMNQSREESNLYKPLKQVQTDFALIQKFGIHFDSVAYGWLEDSQKNIIAHPGELPTSTAFIGFERNKNIGVVILINQESSNTVSAKFLGAKLLNELISD